MCQRCFKPFPAYVEGGDNKALQGLDNAHCFGRGNKKTRFEPDNCAALCMGCHSIVDADPEEKRNLFIKKVGKKRYMELRVFSHETFRGYKKELKAISKKYRELFREINKGTRC